MLLTLMLLEMLLQMQLQTKLAGQPRPTATTRSRRPQIGHDTQLSMKFYRIRCALAALAPTSPTTRRARTKQGEAFRKPPQVAITSLILFGFKGVLATWGGFLNASHLSPKGDWKSGLRRWGEGVKGVEGPSPRAVQGVGQSEGTRRRCECRIHLGRKRRRRGIG